MRYELGLAWRYLHARDPGSRGRGLVVATGAALVVAAGAVVALALAASPSALAAGVFAVALVLATACGLLARFRVFTAVSILGVAFGVAALVLVLGVTSGFEAAFRERVLGVNAHVTITKAQNTFAEYRDVERTARAVAPDVIAAEPFIFAEMLVTRGRGELAGVALKGVDPARVDGVLDLGRHLIAPATSAVLAAPRAEGEPPPVLIGKTLATTLKARVGDRLTMVVPLSNLDLESGGAPRAAAPRAMVFRVAGVFSTGFDEYDRHLIYAALADVQALVGRGDQVMGVELKLRSLDRAPAVAAELERALGGEPFAATDWYAANQTLFSALALQKVVLVVILTLIVLVAAVNMVSALAMLVVDKTREIAILRAMGATTGGVAQVFEVVGAVIGGLGVALGIGIGVALAIVVRDHGYALDPHLYGIDRLPIELRARELAAVAGATLAICTLAATLPAVAASSLRPVDGLRAD